jgi:hypothetical protein
MSLTIQEIQTAESDEALFNLLSAELQRSLSEPLQEDRELYHQTLTTLPQGLRAMAGMHFFDVSMSLDSLAWHFGNQNDDRDLQETLSGLRELELPEIADMFEQMWNFMKPHMSTLQTGDFGGKEFSDWLTDIGAEDFADKNNKYIREYCDKHSDYGLLSSWLTYARKYPERCVVGADQA